MTPDPIRAALERLIELNDHPDTEYAAWNDAVEVARAALAAVPEGEVGELVAWLEETGHLAMQADGEEGERYFRAAARMAQLSAAAPAVVPVAVSEQPWERPGWCDEQGRCWLQGKVEGDWRLLDPINSGVPQLRYCFSHSLPAHAIPLPVPQCGEGK